MLDGRELPRVVTKDVPARTRRRLSEALTACGAELVHDDTWTADDLLIVWFGEPTRHLTLDPPPRALFAVVPARSGELMQAAFECGADDVVSADAPAPEIVQRAERAVAVGTARARQSARRARPASAPPLLGSSRAMAQIRALTDTVARGAAPIAISGEPGTGKQRLARRIHHLSGRRAEAFRRGEGERDAAELSALLAASDGGTVFLRRVHTVSAACQAALDEFLETGRLPGGPLAGRRVDVRVIVDTTPAPPHTAAGSPQTALLPSLARRLAVVTLSLPRLRDRPDDIEILASAFLGDADFVSPAAAPRSLSLEAVAALRAHPWPGNVKELQSVCRVLQARPDAGTVTAPELGPLLGPPTPTGVAPLIPLAELERRHVLAVVQALDGNRRRAAEVLGIAPRTLYERLRRYHGTVGANEGGRAVGDGRADGDAGADEHEPNA